MPDPLEPLYKALEAINDELTSNSLRLNRLEDAAAMGGMGAMGGDGEAVPGAPVVWNQLETADRDAQWSEFVSWVIWMSDTYELTNDQLPRACWWEHGAVVEELTALWTGHRSVYSAQGDASAGPSMWQDALERSLARIGRLWVFECMNGFHKPSSRQRWGTDASYRADVAKVGPPGVSRKPTS